MNFFRPNKKALTECLKLQRLKVFGRHVDYHTNHVIILYVRTGVKSMNLDFYYRIDWIMADKCMTFKHVKAALRELRIPVVICPESDKAAVSCDDAERISRHYWGDMLAA